LGVFVLYPGTRKNSSVFTKLNHLAVQGAARQFWQSWFCGVWNIPMILRSAALGLAITGSTLAASTAASAGEPSYDWSGFYAGPHFGWAQPQNDGASLSGDPAIGQPLIDGFGRHKFAPSSLSSSLNGFVGGGQVGYNQQYGAIVVGLEADFSGSAVNDRSSSTSAPVFSIPLTTSIEDRLQWLGTVRGRVGYVPINNLLIFGTGGLAYGKVEETLSFSNGGALAINFLNGSVLSCPANSPPCLSGSFSDTHVGWTAGGGFEWALDSNTTFRTEYLYVDLGSAPVVTAKGNQNAGITTTPDVFLKARFTDIQENIVRGGLNFKF
jgi:outer membrane immunogenic protein